MLDCALKKVHFDVDNLPEIKEAITRESVRGLISAGVIRAKPDHGISRGRIRANQIQKHKGRRQGKGSRKGKRTARLTQKESWSAKVRVQRLFLKELREKGYLDPKTYRMLYLKTKGGFFRSKRHVKLYLEEQKLALKPTKSAKDASR